MMGGYSFEEGYELKECTLELDEQQISVLGDQFNQIYEMVESKVKETTLRIEQVLAEEQTAQLKTVENTITSQKKSDKEIQKKWTQELDEHDILQCDEQFKRIFEMTSYLIGREVESKLKESTLKVEQLLTEERTARMKAEISQKNSDDKIRKLQEQLAEEVSGRLKIEENAKAAQEKSEEEIKKFELKLKETSLKLEQVSQQENSKAAQRKCDKEIQKVIESKLMEATFKIEQMLTEERTARMKAQGNAEICQKKSENEIHKVESNLKETTLKLEQLLAEEWFARLKMEKNIKVAQKKSEEKLHKFESKLKETSFKLQKQLKEEVTTCLEIQQNSYEEIHKFELKVCEPPLKLEQVLAEEESEIGISVDQSCVFPTLTLSEKFKVLNACLETENWLREKEQVQAPPK